MFCWSSQVYLCQCFHGNNNILSRAGEAKTKTEEKQKDEEIKVAVLGSYNSNANLDIDTLLKNLNLINDIIVTPTEENGTNTFPVIVESKFTTYEISSNGDFKELVIADRTGISIGDYITYISPTASVTLNTDETGYDSEQTLEPKTLFRVMDIDKYGNLTLMGAMTDSDKTIYFNGSKGYNNAVYTLNNICSNLYKDTVKGITARSIKDEDITYRMIEGIKGETLDTSTGRKKIEKYQDEQVAKLSLGTNITNISTTNNIVTYKTITNYPDLFQYEEGGKIGDRTTGIPNTNPLKTVKQSESYSEYNGLTTNTIGSATTSLSVPFTGYDVTIKVTDIDDSRYNALALHNMFFETDTNFWLASRCIEYNQYFIFFEIHCINKLGFNHGAMYNSTDIDIKNSMRICPIVTIPSSVEVKVSTDTSEYHKAQPHTVVTN